MGNAGTVTDLGKAYRIALPTQAPVAYNGLVSNILQVEFIMSQINRRSLLQSASVGAIAAVLSADGSAQTKVDPYASAVRIDGEPAGIAKDSFTIVVLPDTQIYSESYPEQFLAQTRWIADNKLDRNIACVLHLGDVTNRNTAAEWDNAVNAMKQLDDVVPYFMVPGNHDYSQGGACKDRNCGLSAAFPVDKFKGRQSFGGVYDREPDRSENSFHLFTAGGRDFLSLCLEFGPRKDVVRWANEVIGAHHARAVILSTHAFTYFDDSRYDWERLGTTQHWNPHAYGVAKSTDDDVTDGEELWNGLVAQHENVILTLNGHVLGDGLGRMVSETPSGRHVHQMLVNFQMLPNGGDGWLRLLEFHQDGKTVDVCDYSPTLDQRNESPQNKFQISLSEIKA